MTIATSTGTAWRRCIHRLRSDLSQHCERVADVSRDRLPGWATSRTFRPRTTPMTGRWHTTCSSIYPRARSTGPSASYAGLPVAGCCPPHARRAQTPRPAQALLSRQRVEQRPHPGALRSSLHRYALGAPAPDARRALRLRRLLQQARLDDHRRSLSIRARRRPLSCVDLSAWPGPPPRDIAAHPTVRSLEALTAFLKSRE